MQKEAIVFEISETKASIKLQQVVFPGSEYHPFLVPAVHHSESPCLDSESNGLGETVLLPGHYCQVPATWYTGASGARRGVLS